jgi:integrase
MSQRKRHDTGTWQYEFQYAGVTYRKSGFASMKDARDAESEHRRALKTPPPTALPPESPSTLPPLGVTLKDYFELWMSDHVKVNCRPRVIRGYRQCMETHVLPVLGATPLTSLTRAAIRGHFAHLAQIGLSRNTIKNCLIPLRACLNLAVEDGLLDQNPSAGIGKRVPRAKTEAQAAKVASYSQEELLDLGRAADQYLTPELAAFIQLLARSGLRLGEALGLQTSDLAADHLWVRRTVQWNDKAWEAFAPKNGHQRRVDVPPHLVTRLATLATPGPFIFGGEQPWRPEYVRKQWYALVKRLGARRLRLHDLRHTYACLLLQAGAPPSYVKEQLGHSSIQVTIDLYGHMIPGANRKWVDNTF